MAGLILLPLPKEEQIRHVAGASFPLSVRISAACVHLMLLPLCASIWPPGPPVTAGRQFQGQARGERATKSSTSLGTRGQDPKVVRLPNLRRGHGPVRAGTPPQQHPTPSAGGRTVRASFEGCGSHMGSSQTEHVVCQRALCVVGPSVLLLCLRFLLAYV